MTEQTISIERMEEAVNLFGSFDENIRIIERELSVAVVSRDGELKVSGEGGGRAGRRPGHQRPADPTPPGGSRSTSRTSAISSSLSARATPTRSGSWWGMRCASPPRASPSRPRPSGRSGTWRPSGKTPSPWASARRAPARPIWRWRRRWRPSAAGQVNRIILTRPAVEAGERLGFLPGDLQSKVDPYLRPLYDALFDMLGTETYHEVPGAGQHRGGPPGLHARPHPGRLLHHPGRGPEHLPGADEDVPHPAGLRLQDRHHRRRDPDRPARPTRSPA